ncbi:DNA-binding pseudobarrel domain-containing protein [Artemisia annua]|uniref:DNA-binding pseudobarrel domain-containing protein n=1 Tax=Artemisia annua TaxID=35608 RepID=A0A2U1L8J5_ARTAN|nr:DNA-binding pseudobarrel domain-containing protein [Artemisia annua]
MALSNPPSFIKILHDHDAPYLALPHDFVTKYMVDKIPEDVVIRSANGGFLWNVKMKQIGESVCFAKGWSKVVRDAHFGYEDIIVLWFVGETSFKMWIYGPNACEKILLPQTKHVKLEDDVVADDEDFATTKKTCEKILLPQTKHMYVTALSIELKVHVTNKNVKNGAAQLWLARTPILA